MDDEQLKDLLALVYYDNQSKSVLLNVSGFKTTAHGKTVADWIIKKLNIETITLPGEDIPDNNTTVH